MSKIVEEGLKALPSGWEEILNIIEKGEMEYREALVFKEKNNHLLMGCDGDSFLVQYKRKKIRLPSTIIDRIKNRDRKILLKVLKEREESKEKNKTELLVSLAKEECNFFIDQCGDAYASKREGDAVKVMKIRDDEFESYLSRLLYERGKRTPSSETINVTKKLLEGEARFGGNRRELSLRVASREGKIYYDMGGNSWRMIEIDKEGWRIVPHRDPIFKRYNHQVAQVEPAQVDAEGFKLLGNYLPLNDDDKMLFLVQVASFLLYDIPKPIMLLYGGQGSGKSTALRLIRRIIDPSNTEILTMQYDPREFIQQLVHNYFAPFDNVSHLTQWQSDTLCRAVTGGGISKRKLFSDDSDVIYTFKRAIALNGINIPADKPDLLDRCIPYSFEKIPDTDRISEEMIFRVFEQDRPKIFGGLLSTISKALKIYPQVRRELANKPMPRMVDFVYWGEAIGRAMGYDPFRFYSTYWNKLHSLNKETIEAHVVGDLILKFVEKELEKDKEEKHLKRTEDDKIVIWNGTPSALYSLIESLASEYKINTKSPGFPKSSNALTRKLNEIKSNLEDEGIVFERMRTPGERKIIIYKVEEDKKVKRNTVITVISSYIRRKFYDGIYDDIDDDPKYRHENDDDETNTVIDTVINSTGGDDGNDDNDGFSNISLHPNLKEALFSIIPKEPRSITIEEISQRLKEKGLEVDTDKLRNFLIDLCQQKVIRAIDRDLSSFTKPEEKDQKMVKKNQEKEEKKEERPENGNNNGFLTPEELDLVRKAERIIADGHLPLIPLGKALGKPSYREMEELSAILNKAMSKPRITLLRRDPSGRFYLDFNDKRFTLLALSDFEAYDEDSQKPVKARKGDILSAGPKLTRYLFGRGLVEIVSWEDDKTNPPQKQPQVEKSGG